MLTSAAIGADRPLVQDDVKIDAIEPSADGGVTVRVSLGEYRNLLAGDQALLRAALGVAGAYGLGGANAFSAENVTVSAKTVEAEAVELQAKPKSVSGGAPSQFFYRATAR